MKLIFFLFLLLALSSCLFNKTEQPEKTSKTITKTSEVTTTENQTKDYLSEERKIFLNNHDFLGMDIDLVYDKGSNYRLIAKQVPAKTKKIEILHCDEKNPQEYIKNWQKVSNFTENSSAFIYSIKPVYKNFCKLPYKIQLTGDYGVKNITIDLYLHFINRFNNPQKGERKRWPMRSAHLNTFTILKEGEVAVDKNLLFDTYYANYTELVVSPVKNYKTYRFYKGLLLGDGNIISYRYPRGDKNQLFFYDRMAIDLPSFKHLKWSYFEDNNGYYQLSDKNDRKLIILGDKSKSFDILSKKVYRYGDSFFYGNTELPGVDKESFEVFSYEDRKVYNNEIPEVSAFARDKHKVYFQIDTGYGNAKEQKYLTALAADFETLKYHELNLTQSWVFVDKNKVFFPSGKLIPHTFDIQTFTKEEEGNIFADKNGFYYFLDESIIEFDKKSFERYGNGIIKDKDKIYSGTKKLDIPTSKFNIISEQPLIAVHLDGTYYRNCIERITPKTIEDLLQVHSREKNQRSTAWKSFSWNLLHTDGKKLYKNVCN